MVQEVRSILFTAEECHTAVTQLMIMKVGGLRTDQINRVDLAGPEIVAEVTTQVGKTVTVHRIDAAELMSAILLFCRKSRIPLSTRSHKRLGIVAGCLSLTTSINLRAAAPTVAGDTIAHTNAGPDLAMMHTTTA